MSDNQAGFVSKYPLDYQPAGEAGRCYAERVRSGFFDRYAGGAIVLDVGYLGYDNPENKVSLPGAIGVDTGFPGYDRVHLPFADGTVDTVFSSHCLEHIADDNALGPDQHSDGAYEIEIVIEKIALPAWTLA